jgi:hypothetical protein
MPVFVDVTLHNDSLGVCQASIKLLAARTYISTDVIDLQQAACQMVAAKLHGHKR